MRTQHDALNYNRQTG